MRTIVCLLLFAALTGCGGATSEAKAAERRYKILSSREMTLDERCAALREVSAAWLKAENHDKWEMADLAAGVACSTAEVDRLRLTH